MCKNNGAYLLLFLLILPFSCTQDSNRLSALRTFGDNVLEKVMDRWSGKNCPLLADGINVNNQEPLEYIYDGEIAVRGEGGAPNRWIIHNLANQQDLFISLTSIRKIKSFLPAGFYLEDKELN